jgi:hypothetical protein
MIPRHALPQIPKEKYKDFIKFLEENGIKVSLVVVDTESLKPIQAHVNREKVDSFKKKPSALKLPVIISQGGLILDGHHRWIARLELAGDNTSPYMDTVCIMAHCGIKKLVEMGHEFEGSFTKSVFESTIYGRYVFEDCQDDDEPNDLIVRKTLKWK